MSVARVQGLAVGYEVVGDRGRPWTLTPGGRYPRDTPGLRQLAEAIAERGNRVVIWDRPSCGESDVCFEGPSESATQADVLAGLLHELDLVPAVIAGGSGGSRVSLLTAERHPDVAQGLALWWISGGTYGQMVLGTHYCGESLKAAWHGGMEAVAALPEWAEAIERNPANRERILGQDRDTFIETMDRWMSVYCPCGDAVVPGLPDEQVQAVEVPALVFRSGASDLNHPRVTSEQVAGLLPHARLEEPPWPDQEWNDRHAPDNAPAGLFVRWPLLAPQMLAWADEALPPA